MTGEMSGWAERTICLLGLGAMSGRAGRRIWAKRTLCLLGLGATSGRAGRRICLVGFGASERASK